MHELPEDYRELQQIAVDRGLPATGTADELKARIIAANNPATEQYADQIREREYRVTAPHPVLGHEPNTTFRAVIEPGQEQRLIGRGQITPVEATASDGNHAQEG